MQLARHRIYKSCGVAPETQEDHGIQRHDLENNDIEVVGQREPRGLALI